MSKGKFVDFENALRAFESGVNEARYKSGDISEAQLRQWLGDDAWHQLKSGEVSWREAQYMSANSLGFVGYQLGEALLIDLGYYRDSSYYGGPGSPPVNSWDGTFTGKGGVTSLAALKTPVQEGVMLSAFAFNLRIIRDGLKSQGQDLDDILGQTRSFATAEGTVSIKISLTGILAAAHLRGAFGVLDLLLNNSQSSDENGTSILKYLKDFGGYDGISVASLMKAFETGKTLTLAESLWKTDFNHDGKGGPVFTGKADEKSGSDIADTLDGLAGNDRIDGKDGADTIDGGSGKDVLTGGRGNDTFLFDTTLSAKSNVDEITDFTRGHDGFELHGTVFKGLAHGELAPSAFRDISHRGADPSDRILYKQTTGDLFFDRDGAGAHYDPVKFAHLDHRPALSAGDFFVV